MADYGVPEDLEGTLPWSWAEERLAASRNFWLVTVSGAGRPHAMPVWGVWMPDQERFAFSCSPNARKVRNLAANDQVVVTNDDAVNVISMEGRAVRISGADVDAMCVHYQAKYRDEQFFDSLEFVTEFMHQNAAYAVIPDRAFGVIETPEDFGPRATKWTGPENGHGVRRLSILPVALGPEGLRDRVDRVAPRVAVGHLVGRVCAWRPPSSRADTRTAHSTPCATPPPRVRPARRVSRRS